MNNRNYKVSGFTFIKNGLSLGYPFLESVQSIEPICDEIVINIGFEDPECTKDDGTYEYLTTKLKGDKYVFLKSWWDPEKTKSGLILSEQTNIALEKITGDYGVYIQGDEGIHEQDHQAILKSIDELEKNQNADALLFHYHHFFGSTEIEKVTKKTYRQELRVIRNGKGIKSWLDAQGFRYADDRKVRCIRTPAYIFHYGWARSEQLMNKKTRAFSKLYHGQDHESKDFSYSRVWGLRRYYGTHPAVMEKWISENKNEMDIMKLPLDVSFKDSRIIISDFIEYLTGHRFGEYQNYVLI